MTKRNKNWINLKDHGMGILRYSGRRLLYYGPQSCKYIFHLALYDLDDFRLQIFENNLLGEVEMEPDRMEAIKTDDVELLKFVIEWVKRESKGVFLIIAHRRLICLLPMPHKNSFTHSMPNFSSSTSSVSSFLSIAAFTL